MNPFCNPAQHLSRRAFLKGTLAIADGAALANFGSLFKSQSMAAEVKKKAKHCILLWMDGGVSQIDTFDMKPGRRRFQGHLPRAEPVRRRALAGGGPDGRSGDGLQGAGYFERAEKKGSVPLPQGD